MPIGMGVANLKLTKGGRELKKAKHCTIPKTLKKKKKSFCYEGTIIENRKWKKKKPQWRINTRCTKPSLGERERCF